MKKTPHTIITCTINNLRAIDNQEEEVVGSCSSHLAALKKAKALNKDATKALITIKWPNWPGKRCSFKKVVFK